MANTLATVAVLGAILFGVIPFGPDWWRNLRGGME
jgi:hypothetical protein